MIDLYLIWKNKSPIRLARRTHYGQSLVLNGQWERRVPDRDLPLPPELRDRSRNVGEEEEDAQELKLVEGVSPKTSWTVGR